MNYRRVTGPCPISRPKGKRRSFMSCEFLETSSASQIYYTTVLASLPAVTDCTRLQRAFSSLLHKYLQSIAISIIIIPLSHRRSLQAAVSRTWSATLYLSIIATSVSLFNRSSVDKRKISRQSRLHLQECWQAKKVITDHFTGNQYSTVHIRLQSEKKWHVLFSLTLR